MSKSSIRDVYTCRTVVFRVDASIDIGSGHVMRCLTLAEALRAQGSECQFICREHPGNLIDHIRDRGFLVTGLAAGQSDFEMVKPVGRSLPAHAAWLGVDGETDAEAVRRELQIRSPDLLVVDHYALDCAWERALRAHSARLMVIDDLADRPHDCDVLLDQNLGRKPSDYVGLVPSACTMLIGPEYALLRPEFAALREYSLKRRQHPQLGTILISMGGVDQRNATGLVLGALKNCNLPEHVQLIVIMGANAPWLHEVQEMAMALPWRCQVKVAVDNMAKIMAHSDLAIGAAGSTSWERCALGVPSILIRLAINQKSSGEALRLAGAACFIEGLAEADKQLPSLINSMHVARLRKMSELAAQLCDGNGTARVAAAMGIDRIRVRKASELDLAMILRWRNHPSTRNVMNTKHEISESEHREWFAKAATDTFRHLLIVEDCAQSLGFVQFNEKKDTQDVAEWGFYVVPDSPRGTGTRLGNAALSYAFRELGYKKIIGNVIQANERSKRFHEKLGFLFCGLVNEDNTAGSINQQMCRFELSEDAWRSRAKAYEKND